jgi:hypothetical protein
MKFNSEYLYAKGNKKEEKIIKQLLLKYLLHIYMYTTVHTYRNKYVDEKQRAE